MWRCTKAATVVNPQRVQIKAIIVCWPLELRIDLVLTVTSERPSDQQPWYEVSDNGITS